MSFVSSPDYENPADAGANNIYDVTVQVSDGSLTDTQDIAVTVTAVNEAPGNTAPASQTVQSDTSRVFSAANGNLISVANVDAGTLTSR